MVQIVLLILSLLIVGLVLFYQRAVKNMADMMAARDKSYEEEKGKNIATKEDIAEITKQIENVKAEISFENQRKKEYIDERKKHLVNVLYYAEKIQMVRNRLFIYARNADLKKKLYELIDEVNCSHLEMTHESDLIIAEYYDIEDIKVLTILVDTTSKFTAEIVTIAHNVVVELNKYWLARENADKFPSHSSQYLTCATDATNKAAALAEAPMEYKDEMKEAVNNYIVWLHRLIGMGLNYRYELKK